MYTYTTPTITCTLDGVVFDQVDHVRIAVSSKTSSLVRIIPVADIDTETGEATVLLTQEETAAPLGNLNVDGWEQEQMLQHMIDCINSTNHDLT